MSVDGCSVLIRLAPVVTVRELQEPESARPPMFQEGSLVSLHRETPVVVDHRKSDVVGRVLEFFAYDDAQGGRWHWAHCEITAAPDWLRRGGPCSFAYSKLGEQDMGTWTRVLRAAVHEVSILSPGVEPREPRARVAWITPAAERSVSAAREQVIHHPRGTKLVRRGIGQVLGVR